MSRVPYDNREETRIFFAKCHSSTLALHQEELQRTLVSRQYRITQYVSSLLATKTCGTTGRVSELKIHFPTSRGMSLYIDHAIIERGRHKQKVKSLRVPTSIDSLVAHVAELADRPICFSSVSETASGNRGTRISSNSSP